MPKPIKTGTKPTRKPKIVFAALIDPAPEVREESKAKGVDKKSIRESNEAVTIHVPKDLLAEIDKQLPSPEHRESFILAAVRAHLLDRSQPRKVTKAIAQSTSGLKTGRYDE